MIEYPFDMREALGFGWRTMREHLWFFVGLGVVTVLVSGGLQGGVVWANQYSEGGAILLGLVSFVVGIVIDVGFIVIPLRFCDGEQGEISDLFNHYALGPQYFIASLLYSLMVLVGFILLVVPGVILAIMFQFYGYHIVDEGVGAIEALKRSAAITRGTKWRLLLFGLLVVLINIAGALCLVVGLIATVPTTIVAYAYVFRKLQGGRVIVEEGEGVDG